MRQNIFKCFKVRLEPKKVWEPLRYPGSLW
jgi:hypothetical protein